MIDALIGIVCLVTPNPDYPQYPRNWVVDHYLEVLETERREFETIMVLLGVERNDDDLLLGTQWEGGSWNAQAWIARWYRNRQQREMWEHLGFVLFEPTNPEVWRFAREHHKERLIKLIGREWFDRGWMPLPWSLEP